jgi:hypothetical protein
VYVAGDDSWGATSVLVHEDCRGILVDTQLLPTEASRLAGWAAERVQHLTAIWITDACGTHYLGLQALRRQFPHTPILATSSVAKEIARSHREEAARWRALHPTVSDPPILPTPTETATLHVGHVPLHVIRLPGTDNGAATALWHPASKTLIAGDAVWDDQTPYLGHTTLHARQTWLESLDLLEKLHPNRVIGGHTGPGASHDLQALSSTRHFVAGFDARPGEREPPPSSRAPSHDDLQSAP